MAKEKTIGILTSGGDAPGMNAAIRAIVLSATELGYSCLGFTYGYNGLIDGDYRRLTPDDVCDIIHHGGTILKSARCPQMHSDTGLLQAVNTLQKAKVDALVVIGGDGSFNGLISIAKHWQGQIIGVPGTIDNDIDGADSTIGFSTAVDTAIHAIDKIRDTANAFERVFIVEVMGRHSDHIAYNVGVATGAEDIISFDNFAPTDKAKRLNKLANHINIVKAQKHRSFIILVAENLWEGGIASLASDLKTIADIDSATCILGHIQRGGSPVAKDRILATNLGIAAVDALNEGKSGVMIGEKGGHTVEIDLDKAVLHTKQIAEHLINAQRINEL